MTLTKIPFLLLCVLPSASGAFTSESEMRSGLRSDGSPQIHFTRLIFILSLLLLLLLLLCLGCIPSSQHLTQRVSM